MNCEKGRLEKSNETDHIPSIAKNLSMRFLDSDDDDQFFDNISDDDIVCSSESESFISTSDELIKSSSDSDSEAFDESSFASLLPAKKNNYLNSSHECKIVECNSSYSEDNECNAIDTNIPEPETLFEFTEMGNEHSNSSESEEMDELE